MKKVFSFILFSFSIIVSSILLVSCGNSLPKTEHEKVKYAFNGVEKSLKNSSRNNKELISSDLKSKNINYKDNIDDSLKTIFDSLEKEGNETNNPDFSYNEPPMIQFQYLKAIYEEIGDSFTFNNKYTYDFTGEIYYDFKAREATKDDKYLNQYNFNFSLMINIDSSDLIIALAGFDLTYTNGNDSHHQKMYAKLELDYDMEKTSSNYELKMNYIDDLLDYKLDEEKYINNEYDYVKVENDSIKEWRKFGICSPMDLSKINDNDYIYKYSALRGYKDSYKYKITNPFNKDNNLKKAVINILDTDKALADYKSFYQLSGNNNDKIKTVVDRFNKIFGSDVINDIVYTGATEQYVSASPTNILIENQNMKEYEGSDIEISNLLNYYNVYYADENNNIIGNANINDLKILFQYASENQIEVNKNDKISECIIKYNNSNIIENNYNSPKITITIKNEEYNIEASIYMTISNNILEIVKNHFDSEGTTIFPTELEKYDIPKYNSSTAKYKLTKTNNNYQLMVIDDNLDLNNYSLLLGKNGYTLSNNKYTKKINGNIVTISTSKNDGNFTLDIEITADSGESSSDLKYWPYELVSSYIGIPSNYILIPTGNNLSFEVNENDGLIIKAKGFTEEELNTYLSNLSQLGYVEYSNNEMTAYKFKTPDEMYIYKFNIISNSTDLYIEYNFVQVTEITYTRYSLVVNDSSGKVFELTDDMEAYHVEIELKQNESIYVLVETNGSRLDVNLKNIKSGNVMVDGTYNFYIKIGSIDVVDSI